GHRVDERHELGDVVDVRGRGLGGERVAPPAGQQVVVGAAVSAVYWARAGSLAPPKARTWEESIAARSKSISPAAWSFAKSTSWRRRHTPCSCHSLSRRQQVTPEPQPISWGRSSQGMP